MIIICTLAIQYTYNVYVYTLILNLDDSTVTFAINRDRISLTTQAAAACERVVVHVEELLTLRDLDA